MHSLRIEDVSIIAEIKCAEKAKSLRSALRAEIFLKVQTNL